MVLDYLYRYNCQSGVPDHLLDAVEVSGDRAIVGGNMGLALVDLAALPIQGSDNYLYRLPGMNARTMYVKDDTYVYVNVNRTGDPASPGFVVVKMTGNTLTRLVTIDESNVFYEKMCIDGDYLYVAARDAGLRIFSLTDPENPVLVGSLGSPLMDSWAVTVEGNTAYVADGAGGLKIIDVTNKAAPFVIDGEDLSTASGTSEDVTVRNGTVYVAAGGSGLAVYPNGVIANRRNSMIPGCTKDLAWVGDYIAVATLWDIVIFDPGAQGWFPAPMVAKEIISRRAVSGDLRMVIAVAGASGNRLLAANWNYVDVYELKPVSQSTQATVMCNLRRLRFSPSGGTKQVMLVNPGNVPVTITDVTTTYNSFSTNYQGGVIQPGSWVSVLVNYNGSSTEGSDVMLFANDTIDKNPFPVQVHGTTEYIDPTETVPDFTLNSIRPDPAGGYIEEPFTLYDHLGKVVWFNVYASW